LPSTRKTLQKNAIPLVGLGFAVMLLLVGCISSWLVRDATPTLYLEEPVLDGGRGHLSISVTNMPDAGLAAIMVGPEGLLYDEEKVSGIAIEELNGFTIAVSQFANGEGGFILVNTSSALESGPILRLTFDAHGNVKYGDIRLLADHITLVSDVLALIDGWKTPAYYAR
jgi:hypothetical protein